MIGEIVGSYRITERLSSGGMGAVYIAEHTLIGRKAAVKVLLPQLSQRQEIVDRFFQEAKATAAIGHPGIVEIFDFGFLQSGQAYLVMEFLKGESLRIRLRSRRTLPLDHTLDIMKHVTSSLGAAHAKGIVHRDLKPDNIMLVPDPGMVFGERAKILDFGIAKLVDNNESPSMNTRTGAVMGTPSYMAPEQCRGAGHVDHRADLYAVGCILFRMLCGRTPFVAEGGGEIIGMHLFMEPPAPSTFAASLDPAVEALILRLLAKNPADRVQSTDELMAALHALEPAPGMSTRAATGASLPSAAAMSNSDMYATGTPYTPGQPQPVLAPVHAASAYVPYPSGSLATLEPASRTTLHAAAAQQSVVNGVGSPMLRRITPVVAAALLFTGVGAVVLFGGTGGGDDIAGASEPAGGARGAEDGGAMPSVAPSDPADPAGASAAAGGNEDGSIAATEPNTAAPDNDGGDRDSDAGEQAAAAQGERDDTGDTASSAATPGQITLRITSVPTGASVYLDDTGDLLGTTPYDYEAPPDSGTLTFELRMSAYKSELVTLAADKDVTKRVTLTKVSSRSGSRPKAPRRPAADRNTTVNPFDK